VDHDHRALAPRQRQHVEDLAVVELQLVIGHVDLERSVAVAHQGRQLLPQHLLGRVGDDQVKGVVDHRLALAAAMIILHRRAQRLALLLAGERNHGGGAAMRRRDRAGMEIVAELERRRHRLIEMDMGVDPARQHVAPRGVDLVRARAELAAQRRDPALLDPDIALEHIRGRGRARIANDSVELGHMRTPLVISASGARSRHRLAIDGCEGVHLRTQRYFLYQGTFR
jgi:hypothetical protein